MTVKYSILKGIPKFNNDCNIKVLWDLNKEDAVRLSTNVDQFAYSELNYNILYAINEASKKTYWLFEDYVLTMDDPNGFGLLLMRKFNDIIISAINGKATNYLYANKLNDILYKFVTIMGKPIEMKSDVSEVSVEEMPTRKIVEKGKADHIS